MISWDIAITDNGPVILEGNYGFGIHNTQPAIGHGLLQEKYTQHINHLIYKK
jgi:hypothetical protein